MVILEQLRCFALQFIRRAIIPHFSFQSNCQQLQWLGVLHIQKTVRDKPSLRRKNSPLTRFVSVYITFLLAFSRITQVSRAPIIGEKNQSFCTPYPGCRIRIQIPLGHSLIFALSSLWLIRLAVKSSSVIQRIAERCGSIWSKIKTRGKTSGRISAHVDSLASKIWYFFACKLPLRARLISIIN